MGKREAEKIVKLITALYPPSEREKELRRLIAEVRREDFKLIDGGKKDEPKSSPLKSEFKL